MKRSVVRQNRGFTLVELMIVVAIIGVLAALAIYGVNQYVTNAKTTEARTALGRISKDATTAYARPKLDTTSLTAGVLAAGDTAAQSNVLCASATPVPDDDPPAGVKYQSALSEWGGDEATGWTCLRFQMTDPQMYKYSYTAVAGTSFEAKAEGDLDGDTTPSSFVINGVIQTDMSLFVSPTIIETDPQE